MFNYDALARHGINAANIVQAMHLANRGHIVARSRNAGEDIGYRVKLKGIGRNSLDEVRQLLIPNRDNRLIPLAQLATLQKTVMRADLRHHQGVRATTIRARVDKKALSAKSVIESVLARFNVSTDYPGTRFVVQGTVRLQANTHKETLKTLLFCVLAIYTILALLFGSLTQPLLILISIPFGLSGIVIVFALHDLPIDFMAMLGGVGLCGVVVNDAVVLVSSLNRRSETPQNSDLDAVARGTAVRLRPILMTTITTAAGLLPLAYGLGGADPTNAPMALSLGWGLVVATPLVLLFVPCAVMVGDDVRRLLGRRQVPDNTSKALVSGVASIASDRQVNKHAPVS